MRVILIAVSAAAILMQMTFGAAAEAAREVSVIERFFKAQKGDKTALPWQGQTQSIYDYLANYEGDPAAYILPDEAKRAEEADGPSWAPGGMDGAMLRHWGIGNNEGTAKSVHKALKKATRSPTDRNLAALYKGIVEHSAIDFIDPFLDLVRSDPPKDLDELYYVAKSLALTSSDREAVKVGIALLGMFNGAPDGASPAERRSIFETLGRHEEFTLYAAVALQNTVEQPDRLLWKLAQAVAGWGRIEIVERLAETQDPDIKAWLLREGYKNDVMYEYTALIVAEAGDLLGAVQSVEPDETLVVGVLDILSAMITEGPVVGISGYEDAKPAVMETITMVERFGLRWEHLKSLNIIRSYLQDEGFADLRANQGWSAKETEAALAKLQEFLSAERWNVIALEKLKNLRSDDFFDNAITAELVGVDVWPYRFQRQKNGYGDEWFHLMEVSERKRAEQVVNLARELIPEATGGKPSFDPSKPFASDPLDWVLQGLRKFPGLGEDLLLIGLDSPNIRNRNMAIQAFQQWGEEHWPEEHRKKITAAINQAEEEEKARIAEWANDKKNENDRYD